MVDPNIMVLIVHLANINNDSICATQAIKPTVGTYILGYNSNFESNER